MGRHHHHSFRGDTVTRISRRPNGRNRDGEITHPTQVTPVAAVAQVVPGVRAQVDHTIMETSGAAVALTEPKKTLTRIEQCAADAAALPTLQASSGVAMVVLDMIDLIVTPSTKIGASQAEINERSSPEAVTAYTAVLIDEISARIKERGHFDSIANLSLSGIPDVVPVRHKEAKLGFSGQFRVRIFAANAEYFRNTIACFAVTTPAMASAECNYEIVVPATALPAKIVNAMAAQTGGNKLGVMCVMRRDRSRIGDNAVAYQFGLTQTQKDLAQSRGYLVHLGPLGQFKASPVVIRPTMESIFAYGTTGVASAELDLKPAVSEALGCSADMVTTKGCSGANRAAGQVICITYPYSVATYDAVTRLLTIGRFKLINPRVTDAKPLTITLAATPPELERMIGIRFLPQITEKVENVEEVEILEYAAPTIGAPRLIPLHEWEAQRAARADAERADTAAAQTRAPPVSQQALPAGPPGSSPTPTPDPTPIPIPTPTPTPTVVPPLPLRSFRAPLSGMTNSARSPDRTEDAQGPGEDEEAMGTAAQDSIDEVHHAMTRRTRRMVCMDGMDGGHGMDGMVWMVWVVWMASWMVRPALLYPVRVRTSTYAFSRVPDGAWRPGRKPAPLRRHLAALVWHVANLSLATLVGFFLFLATLATFVRATLPWAVHYELRTPSRLERDDDPLPLGGARDRPHDGIRGGEPQPTHPPPQKTQQTQQRRRRKNSRDGSVPPLRWLGEGGAGDAASSGAARDTVAADDGAPPVTDAAYGAAADAAAANAKSASSPQASPPPPAEPASSGSRALPRALRLRGRGPSPPPATPQPASPTPPTSAPMLTSQLPAAPTQPAPLSPPSPPTATHGSRRIKWLATVNEWRPAPQWPPPSRPRMSATSRSAQRRPPRKPRTEVAEPKGKRSARSRQRAAKAAKDRKGTSEGQARREARRITAKARRTRKRTARAVARKLAREIERYTEVNRILREWDDQAELLRDASSARWAKTIASMRQPRRRRRQRSTSPVPSTAGSTKRTSRTGTLAAPEISMVTRTRALPVRREAATRGTPERMNTDAYAATFAGLVSPLSPLQPPRAMVHKLGSGGNEGHGNSDGDGHGNSDGDGAQSEYGDISTDTYQISREATPRDPIDTSLDATRPLAATPTALCGAVEGVGELPRAMALATAPVPTTALLGGRRIILDLHPLDMRPLDSVAKAHRRSTSGSLDSSIGARRMMRTGALLPHVRFLQAAFRRTTSRWPGCWVAGGLSGKLWVRPGVRYASGGGAAPAVAAHAALTLNDAALAAAATALTPAAATLASTAPAVAALASAILTAAAPAAVARTTAALSPAALTLAAATLAPTAPAVAAHAAVTRNAAALAAAATALTPSATTLASTAPAVAARASAILTAAALAAVARTTAPHHSAGRPSAPSRTE